MQLYDNMRVKITHHSGVEYGVIESARDASKAITFAMKVTVKMDDNTYCSFPIRWIEADK